MIARKIDKIVYASHFVRAMKSLPKSELPLIMEREKIFRANCFDPKLKTHKLTGLLKTYWSFSITHSHRIMFEFLNMHSVAFIDVGDHSIYQ